MIITISKVAEQTKTSRNGKKYKVIRVEGNKWASEEEWGTDIFKNKTELLDMLDEFGPGDVANFKFVKDGKWPELNEICEPTKEELVREARYDRAKAREYAERRAKATRRMSKEDHVNWRLANRSPRTAEAERGATVCSSMTRQVELMPWLCRG